MKAFNFRFFGLACIALFAVSANAQLGGKSNSIQGFVFDGVTRIPLSDIYVELQNDTYSTLKRVKTDGSGRYYFGGLSAGNFKVKALPFGTNLSELTLDAELVNWKLGNNSYTSDTAYVDFYLKPDPRKVRMDSSGTVGAVFVQEIPSQAKAFYTKALSHFEKKDESELGFENANKSLAAFPDYYDALNRISFEYVRRDKFYEAIPHLVRAVKINQRSFTCYYMLGTVAFKLKQFREAGEAFKAASVLSPESTLAHIKYGMSLRLTQDYPGAEKALLKAVSVSKSDPNPEAYWQLGLLYDKMERYADAASSLEKYLKILPDAENKQQIRTLITTFRAKADKKPV